MKYAIYEDPVTHQFAHLPLPNRFLDGDALPPVVTGRWFESRAAAIAALPELLDRDDEPQAGSDADAQTCIPATGEADLSKRAGVWQVH